MTWPLALTKKPEPMLALAEEPVSTTSIFTTRPACFRKISAVVLVPSWAASADGSNSRSAKRNGRNDDAEGEATDIARGDSDGQRAGSLKVQGSCAPRQVSRPLVSGVSRAF